MFTRRVRIIASLAALLGAFAFAGAAQDRSAAAPSSEVAIPRYQPRFGRERPVIAVVGYNQATELTDYVVPYGVLTESGVAEVVALSTSPGPIQMSPTLRFGAHGTIDDFDGRYRQGADYVIVPNIYD